MDHDISFRPGIGADGSDTYTPRTLIYDLKGAFGTLRRENALYELQRQQSPHQSGPWSGGTLSLQLPPIAPSSYQQALDQGLNLRAGRRLDNIRVLDRWRVVDFAQNTKQVLLVLPILGLEKGYAQQNHLMSFLGVGFSKIILE